MKAPGSSEEIKLVNCDLRGSVMLQIGLFITLPRCAQISLLNPWENVKEQFPQRGEPCECRGGCCSPFSALVDLFAGPLLAVQPNINSIINHSTRLSS